MKKTLKFDNQTIKSPEDRGQNDTVSPGLTEIGGRKGLDPTRFGDYELKGKCVDF